MANEITIKHTAGLGTLKAIGWSAGSRISGTALVAASTISAANWGVTGVVTLTEKVTSDASGVGVYVGDSAYVTDGPQEWYAFEGTPTVSSDDVGRVGFYLLGGVAFEGATGTAASLALMLAKLNAAVVRVTSPVLEDGTVAIVRGDDYLTHDGCALEWTFADWSGQDVDELDVELRLSTKAQYDAGSGGAASFVGSVAMVGDDAVFTVELTAAQTAALEGVPPANKYNYVYQLVTVDDVEHVKTRAIGAATVTQRVAA